MTRHGGQILVRELEVQGVTAAFCVPGESFLAVLDGLHDTNHIQTIVCRQEGGAVMMADAHSRMTGRPGIALVTRGPGATNGSIGVHIAQQDSTPLILFVGLPGRDFADREAFQEFDLTAVFRSLAKWAEVIPDTARIPEYVSRAFHLCQSGRPGPVVLGLPEDVLSEFADVENSQPVTVARAAPHPADMAQLSEMLSKAKRPIAIVGGPGWSARCAEHLGKIATKLQLPVATAFRNQDYFDNRHPCYAGHAGIGIDGKLLARIKGADLLIAIGARLDEMTTNGYTLLQSPEPMQQLVHVFPSGDDMGRVFRPVLAINSSSEAFLDALDALKISAADANQRKTAHGDYEATRKPLPTPGAVKLEEVVLIVNEMLPDDAILTNGAGNYSAFFHRYFEYKHFRTQLGPTCGAMGFGLPAAIGAAIAEPHRTIVALAGDGCFLMNGQELATAKQYGLKLVVLVINNGIYGTIRMHQEKHFPGRPSGTSLTNPDFAALARSFGAHGETVTATKDFRQAFTRALAHDGVALIELQTDPEAITPKQTLTEIRSQPAAAPEKPHGQKR